MAGTISLGSTGSTYGTLSNADLLKAWNESSKANRAHVSREVLKRYAAGTLSAKVAKAAGITLPARQAVQDHLAKLEADRVAKTKAAKRN